MDVTKLYNDVKIFNELAGSLENVNKSSIALQLDLIQEEFLETVQAFDEKDPVEFVDGVADMFVVLSGLMQKLEALGVDVEAAFERVNNNNLSKFSDSVLQQPPKTTATFNKRWEKWVFKNNQTGKIMKPLDFSPVDLSGINTGKLLGVLSQDLEE